MASSSSSDQSSSSPPSSCSVFDPKNYNTNPSAVVDQQNQTSVIQETTATHHQTLGKSEQSVSSAPKRKSTTPFMKTLLINKKPQIIWEQKSRDTKLMMQPKMKKTQPPDENDDVMSTDEEEESENAEEEESESAEEEESESSEGGESESSEEEEETTTTTHHQTLGKSEQSVSSAPKHKSTTPFMKTLMINKKPQIIWEQKSRDTKLVMQPKMKKTQPPDENDDVMSTDEEESESAEEEEIESAEEEESESLEGASERRRRIRRRIGRRYSEYVAKPSRSCSQASSEEYNPGERMIMFYDADLSEDEDDIRLLEYIQEYKEELVKNRFGNSLPLSLTDGRPSKINVGYLLIYIQKDAGKYHGYTATKLRNKILKMQHKYKKLLREKGNDPTPQDFDTPRQKLHFELLKNCFK